MNDFPRHMIDRVTSQMIPEESHLVWPGKQFRLQSAGKWYNVRAILWGSPIGSGRALYRKCSRKGCINPDHLELLTVGEAALRSGRVQPMVVTYCKTCNANMRPPGTSKEDNPGTKLYHSPNLCRSCYNRKYRENKPKPKTPLAKGWQYTRIALPSPRLQSIWDSLLPPGDMFEFDHDIVRRNVPQDLWATFGVK